MIAKITGTVDELKKQFGYAIIDVSGIGYKVFITNGAMQNIKEGANVSLHTHHVIRENIQDLYGFTDSAELEFFNLLLGISGIGPKSALGILNTAPIETIKEGIASGDASHLTKVSGIGKKSAEKIIIELKDKLGSLESHEGSNFEGGGMAIEALTALGYSDREAREAMQKIDKNLTTEEMVREALKNLTN
jgi:Holliday junction DNA helicase RuvA